jgi:hypothetical protein
MDEEKWLFIATRATIDPVALLKVRPGMNCTCQRAIAVGCFIAECRVLGWQAELLEYNLTDLLDGDSGRQSMWNRSNLCNVLLLS